MRFCGTCLFVLVLTIGNLVGSLRALDDHAKPQAAGWAADDPAPDQPEAPLRLKKKAKPPAEEPAPEKQPEKAKPPREPESRDDKGEPDKDPAQETKEVVERVSKNMRAAEDRLAKKDPGDGTRQIQRDILKDLDALIEQAKQQQQQNNSSSSSSSSKSRSQGMKQGSGSKRTQGSQASRAPKAGRTNQPRPGTANQAGGGGQGKEEAAKVADLYKDVWGHLPETLRQEMDQYSREEFMAKYGDLLKQYYATIAEKGRHREK